MLGKVTRKYGKCWANPELVGRLGENDQKNGGKMVGTLYLRGKLETMSEVPHGFAMTHSSAYFLGNFCSVPRVQSGRRIGSNRIQGWKSVSRYTESNGVPPNGFLFGD